MADTAGRIDTLEVRCLCGKGFENAETYLRHKGACGIHQEENGTRTTQCSNQRFATIPTRAPISASSPKPITCWCGRTFKSHHALRDHGRYCAVHKQQTNTHPALNSSHAMALKSVADSVLAAGEYPVLPAGYTAKKIQCPCGQRFATEKALNKHLRYSKTHQARKPESVSMSKLQTMGLVPFTTQYSPPNLILPTLGLLPGTIPSLVLSQASLITCTCGHSFETQRILDLHKRDSLIHKGQTDKSPSRYKRWDDAIVSSFASLDLESVSTQIMPSVARFACMCGRMFKNQKALEQHKRDTRQHVRQDNKERRKRSFETPQPQYQVDEYLRDMAAVLVRQYDSAEY